MRRILLWLATNDWLLDRVMRRGFARRAVRWFMPGEDDESALRAAAAFQAEGIGALFTRLGENLIHVEEADAVASHYVALVDSIHERGLAGELSVKLTQLGLDLDGERAFRHMGLLAERADAAGQILWIDMEGSRYTERRSLSTSG